MSRAVIRLGALLVLSLQLSGCPQHRRPSTTQTECDKPTTGPLPRCIQTAHGLMDLERDYLPGVLECEMGGFPPAALEAQAVAARTYLARYLERKGGSVPIGAHFQCWKRPKRASSMAAVLATQGLVMRYQGKLLTANYVSGARRRHDDCTPKGPRANGYRYGDWSQVLDIYLTCRRKKRRRPFKGVSWTEVVVTHNEGRSGDQVRHTPMGSEQPRNRGAMSQYGAACLARRDYSAQQILQYYYGADVEIIAPLDAPIEGELPELVIPTVGEDELTRALEDEQLPSLGAPR